MQISGFMVTNGGAHPADRWAELTAETILNLIVIVEDSVTDEAAAARAAKRDLRYVLFDILNQHHDDVQKGERGNVPTDPHAHVAAPLEPMPHVEPTMMEIRAAFAASPFAAHFAKMEVQSVLVNIVAQHTADVMHIERRYHQDRHISASKGA
jgi:hypothetical protein